MQDVTLPKPAWIDTPAALDTLAAGLSQQKRIAVDTESNSLHAYQEQVCLLQFSTPDEDYLVDPLVLADFSSLQSLLENSKIEKVFHAAEYDLICLKRSFGIRVTGIFDTMQAARILGYKQVGLEAILLEKMGIQHDKKYQKADWATRPLLEEMLNYARYDTHYLLPLRDLLQSELEKKGRWELAQEEFRRLACGCENGKIGQKAWQRVKGIQHFSDRQITILQEICEWRDEKASKLDRPVFKVIDNDRLVAVVEKLPVSERQLEAAGLTPRQVKSYGHDLIEAVKRGRKKPLLHRPRLVRPDQEHMERAKALSEWRKNTAVKWGIESDLILPKAWLGAISENNPATIQELAECMPDSPWRVNTFGADILEILSRKKSLLSKER